MKTMLAQDMKLVTNFYALLKFLKFLYFLVHYKRQAFPDVCHLNANALLTFVFILSTTC